MTLAALVFLPLTWASAAFLLGARYGRWLAQGGLLLQAGFAAFLVWQISDGGKALGHAVGGWGAPLGIDWAVDGLNAVMLLLVHGVALLVATYAGIYHGKSEEKGGYFWALLGFLVAGLDGLLLTTDLFNAYVTLEIIGLCAVALVAADGGREQLSAALRYLFATLIGSTLYLLGVALLYGVHGHVAIGMLASAMAQQAVPADMLAAGLMLVGLSLKTALFPFHYWLPAAHGGAPAPVSALLSALVVKASFYLILRLWWGPFAALVTVREIIAWLLAAAGAAAIVWGSWQAIGALRLKMLIAYSTVAQLGYLFLLFPFLHLPQGRWAVFLQLFGHGLAKAGMFLAAGVLTQAAGGDGLERLAGAAQRQPLALSAFALAGVTLMGLPPSLGFLAKWSMISAALEQGHGGIVVVALGGGLLTAFYVFRVLRLAFLHTDSPVSDEGGPPSRLAWVAFALAAASVLLGLRAVELVQLGEVAG